MSKRQSTYSQHQQEQRKFSTAWLADAMPRVEAIPAGTVLTIDSEEIQFLSDSAVERESKLRDLTGRGFLHMESHFAEDGKTWLGFSWTAR